MKTQKHKKLIGGLAALSVLALSVLPSSLTFAADKEFYDTTYYNAYYDYDYNIRSVLQLPSDLDGVGVYANSSGQYIDSDGYDTIYPSYSGNTIILDAAGQLAYAAREQPGEALLSLLRSRIPDIPSAAPLRFFHSDRGEFIRVTARRISSRPP